MEPVWYAYNGKKYEGEFPGFFDVKDFGWATIVEENYPLIKTELDAYIQKQSGTFEPYFNKTLVNHFKSWKTSNFIFWSKKVKQNASEIPETIKIFEKIPGLTTLAISVLEPAGHIQPHRGDTNAIIRCHLGLHVPADSPTCALKVRDEVKGWNEGKLLLFCDAWEHEAWNKAEIPRYVLIFDVIHPHYLSQKRKICANVRSWLDLQKWYERSPRLRKAGRRVKIFTRKLLRLKYLFG